MSDTPETDSFTHSVDETPLDEWVYAGHAMRLERERDEARKSEEINASVTLRQQLAQALVARDQAREVARLAFYIIRGVDPRFVKLAYEKSVYWVDSDQPIQFMRDAIKQWEKEK